MSQPGPYRGGEQRDPYQRPRYAPGPQPQRYAPPSEPGRGRRLPGLGLLLTAVGLVVQVLSLTVLPWLLVGAGDSESLSMPRIWDLATELGTSGFGEWYVVLFGYPLAALGIVLALAAVLDSIALKVIWAVLALVGLGVLVLRFGLGPVAELVTTDGAELDFTTQEITTALIALVAAGVVIFMLKTALSMFRRVAGLVLLALAGVHVAAVVDLVRGAGLDALGIGAYGPALGYLLTAAAAFIGPRRLPGV